MKPYFSPSLSEAVCKAVDAAALFFFLWFVFVLVIWNQPEANFSLILIMQIR